MVCRRHKCGEIIRATGCRETGGSAGVCMGLRWVKVSVCREGRVGDCLGTLTLRSSAKQGTSSEPASVTCHRHIS